MPETRQLRELKQAVAQTAEKWDHSDAASAERKKGAEVALSAVQATINRLANEPAERPSEWTYGEYRGTVESHAESVLTNLQDYPDDFDTVHDAINESVENAHKIIYPGWALMVVLLSEQDPDDPDYGEGWATFCDLSERPTWGRVIMEMARACLYSDVYAELRRCPDCGGMGEGRDERDEWADCVTCDGTGRRDLDALTEGRAEP